MLIHRDTQLRMAKVNQAATCCGDNEADTPALHGRQQRQPRQLINEPSDQLLELLPIELSDERLQVVVEADKDEQKSRIESNSQAANEDDTSTTPELKFEESTLKQVEANQGEDLNGVEAQHSGDVGQFNGSAKTPKTSLRRSLSLLARSLASSTGASTGVLSSSMAAKSQLSASSLQLAAGCRSARAPSRRPARTPISGKEAAPYKSCDNLATAVDKTTKFGSTASQIGKLISRRLLSRSNSTLSMSLDANNNNNNNNSGKIDGPTSESADKLARVGGRDAKQVAAKANKSPALPAGRANQVGKRFTWSSQSAQVSRPLIDRKQTSSDTFVCCANPNKTNNVNNNNSKSKANKPQKSVCASSKLPVKKWPPLKTNNDDDEKQQVATITNVKSQAKPGPQAKSDQQPAGRGKLFTKQIMR